MFKSDEAIKFDAVYAYLTTYGPVPRNSLKVEIEKSFFGLMRTVTVTRVK